MRRFRFLGAVLTTFSLTMSANSPYLSGWVRASAAVLALIALVIGLAQWLKDGAVLKASRLVP